MDTISNPLDPLTATHRLAVRIRRQAVAKRTARLLVVDAMTDDGHSPALIELTLDALTSGTESR